MNTDTNTVMQDFDVNQAGFSYFYPALAVDGEGNLFMLFGYSSPTDYPGIMITAQTSTNTVGTYHNPLTIIRGTGPENSSRYGDYFGAAPDPSNPLIVWMAGEYGTMNGWATRITSIRIATVVIPEFPSLTAVSTLFSVMLVMVLLMNKNRYPKRPQSRQEEPSSKEMILA